MKWVFIQLLSRAVKVGYSVLYNQSKKSVKYLISVKLFTHLYSLKYLMIN